MKWHVTTIHPKIACTSTLRIEIIINIENAQLVDTTLNWTPHSNENFIFNWMLRQKLNTCSYKSFVSNDGANAYDEKIQMFKH